MPQPLSQLVDPGWAQALSPVADQVAHMGDFLRAEVAAGHRYLPAADAILRYADHNRIGHIVIGARSASALRRHLGSVSSKVVAEADCSVTVVRLGTG